MCRRTSRNGGFWSVSKSLRKTGSSQWATSRSESSGTNTWIARQTESATPAGRKPRGTSCRRTTSGSHGSSLRPKWSMRWTGLASNIPKWPARGAAPWKKTGRFCAKNAEQPRAEPRRWPMVQLDHGARPRLISSYGNLPESAEMTETLMHHAASVEAAGRVHPPQGRKNCSVVKRSVIRNGHKSSISLEDQFWDALREIADHEHMAISALVATIDHGRTTNNLSSAIRVFVLDHFRRSDRAKPETAPATKHLHQSGTSPPPPKMSHDEGSRRPPHVFGGDICRLSGKRSHRPPVAVVPVAAGYWTSVQLDHRD